MSRKPPLGLRLDDETENLFREIAAQEERDLSGQFKVIFGTGYVPVENQLSPNQTPSTPRGAQRAKESCRGAVEREKKIKFLDGKTIDDILREIRLRN